MGLKPLTPPSMEQAHLTLEKRKSHQQDPTNEVVTDDDKSASLDLSGTQTPTGKPLATRKKPYDSSEKLGPITEALLHWFWIKRRRVEDLDDIATQPSVFDTDHAEYYRPKETWEVGAIQLLVADERTIKRSIRLSDGLGGRSKRPRARSTSRSLPGSSSCSSP